MATEDFSDSDVWVPTDPGSDYTITAARVEAATMTRARDASVVRDMGVDAIGDFSGVTFTVNPTAQSGADFKQYPFLCVSNLATPTQGDMNVANSGLAFNFFDDTAAPRYFIRVKDYDDNEADQYNIALDALNVPYYIKLSRAGDIFTAVIYSDPTRLLEVDTVLLNGTAATTLFRYVGVVCGDEEGASTINLSFYTEDLDLNLGGESFTAKFRKTFSGIGTGVGKRQVIGV